MLPVFALEPPWYNVLFPAAFIILWVAFLVVAGVLGVVVLWRVYQICFCLMNQQITLI